MASASTIQNANAFAEPLLPSAETVESPDDNECIPGHRRSRNIPLTLAYTPIVFAGRSLWNQSVLPTYVYLLQSKNPETVGLITAVMGMSQLVSSLPTGILADRYRRDSLLKVASVVGVIAVAATVLSVWRESYVILTVALAIWGAFWGIANTSLSALFADSIADGDRSYYFTKRSILIKLGNTAGPLVALLLFALLGDEWTLHDCAIVMLVGQTVCLPSVLILCFLSDDHIVTEPDERLAEDLLSDTSSSESSVVSQPSESDLMNCQEEPISRPFSVRFGCCLPEHRAIPALVALADVMSGLASGMSIRYFPIFFLENLRLSPVIVQVLYILSALMQVVLSRWAQKWAKRFGRCRITATYKWTGICFMFVMILSYVKRLPAWCVCVMFLLRTAFMNSTNALTKSFLMDAVPKHERGKWSVLESVNMFSWSGSAALGGILVSLEGMIFNFSVTASIQLLATIPLVVLFSRDKGEENIRRTSSLDRMDVEAHGIHIATQSQSKQRCSALEGRR